MKKIIVGLGEALWDVLPDGKQLGGAPANFAYHCSQFGFETCVVTAVGADSLGEELLGRFDQNDLKYLAPVVSFPTGTVQVELDSAGIPVYDICLGVAWDNIPFTGELQELAQQTSVVCFGSLAQRSEVSRTTIQRFLDSVPDGEGVYKVFDINLRQSFYSREVIEASLERCNILKINDEELEVVCSMFGCTEGDIQERCMALLSRFDLRLLILTCGAVGSYVFSPTEESYIATPRVEVVDTVGAGDSFTATFIVSLLRGESICDAHCRAVDVSAFVCTQHGAMPVIPERLKF